MLLTQFGARLLQSGKIESDSVRILCCICNGSITSNIFDDEVIGLNM